MKYLKAKQVIAIAMAGAMVLTSAPSTMGMLVQTVYADEQNGEETAIKGVTPVATDKHKASCYQNSENVSEIKKGTEYSVLTEEGKLEEKTATADTFLEKKKFTIVTANSDWICEDENGEVLTKAAEGKAAALTAEDAKQYIWYGDGITFPGIGSSSINALVYLSTDSNLSQYSSYEGYSGIINEDNKLKEAGWYVTYEDASPNRKSNITTLDAYNEKNTNNDNHKNDVNIIASDSTEKATFTVKIGVSEIGNNIIYTAGNNESYKTATGEGESVYTTAPKGVYSKGDSISYYVAPTFVDGHSSDSTDGHDITIVQEKELSHMADKESESYTEYYTYSRQMTENDKLTADKTGFTALETVPDRYVNIKYADGNSYTTKEADGVTYTTGNVTITPYTSTVSEITTNDKDGVSVETSVEKRMLMDGEWDWVPCNGIAGQPITLTASENDNADYRVVVSARTYADNVTYIHFDADGTVTLKDGTTSVETAKVTDNNGNTSQLFAITGQSMNNQGTVDTSKNKSYTSDGITYKLIDGTLSVASFKLSDLTDDTDIASVGYAVVSAESDSSSTIGFATLEAVNGVYTIPESVVNEITDGKKLIIKLTNHLDTSTYLSSDGYYVYLSTAGAPSTESAAQTVVTDADGNAEKVVSVPTKNASDIKEVTYKVGKSGNEKTLDRTDATNGDAANYNFSTNGDVELTVNGLNNILKDGQTKAGDKITVNVVLNVASTNESGDSTDSTVSKWNTLVSDDSKLKISPTTSNISFILTRKDTADVSSAQADLTDMVNIGTDNPIYVAKAGSDGISIKAPTITVDDNELALSYTIVESGNTFTRPDADSCVTNVKAAGKYEVYAWADTDAYVSADQKVGEFRVETDFDVTAASDAASAKTAKANVSVSSEGISAAAAFEADRNTTYTIAVPSGYTIAKKQATGGDNDDKQLTLASSDDTGITVDVKDKADSETFTVTSPAGNTYDLVLSWTVKASSGSVIPSGGGSSAITPAPSTPSADKKDDSSAATTTKETINGYEVTKTTTGSDVTASFKADDITVEITSTQTSSNAVVTNSAKSAGYTIPATVIDTIKKVTGKDTSVAYKANNKTLIVNTRDTAAGTTLYLLDKSGKTTQLVIDDQAAVDKNGNVVVNASALTGSKYKLVNESVYTTFTNRVLKAIKVGKIAGKKGDKQTILVKKGSYANSVKKVAYQSLNTKVATVNSKGVVTLKKAGKATIKVTVTLNNGKTKTFTRIARVSK